MRGSDLAGSSQASLGTQGEEVGGVSPRLGWWMSIRDTFSRRAVCLEDILGPRGSIPGGGRLPARDAPETDMPVTVAFPQVDYFPPGVGPADDRSRRGGQGAPGAAEEPFIPPRGI